MPHPAISGHPGYFLQGERLYLREVRPEDVTERYHRWMNDPDVTRFLECRFYPNSMEKLKEYVASRLGDRDNVLLAMVLQEEHRHIGNIKLGPIDWIHRTGDIGLLVGERDCWGQGYATEAIRVLTDYAFGTLNLMKLTAGAYDPNQGSIRAFQKAGFQIEGKRKRQYFCEGDYVDLVQMGLVRIGPASP